MSLRSLNLKNLCGNGKGETIWTPAQIANINTWFDNDPAYMTMDGSNQVTEWRDKLTGSTKKYEQGTASSAPVWDATNKHLVFNGSKFMTRAITLSTQTNMTFFYVLKVIDGTGYEQYINSHSGSGVISFTMDSAIQRVRAQCGATLNSTNTSLAKMQAEYRLIVINYIAGGTSTILGYNCGATSGDITASGDAGSRTFIDSVGSNNLLYLGRIATSSAGFLNAQIKAKGEKIGTLSAGDLALLKTYCDTYYGSAK